MSGLPPWSSTKRTSPSAATVSMTAGSWWWRTTKVVDQAGVPDGLQPAADLTLAATSGGRVPPGPGGAPLPGIARPGSWRRAASRSATSGAQRSTQPTTPATSGALSARSRSSGVSSSTAERLHHDGPSTWLAPSWGRRSSREKERRSAGRPAVHGWSRTVRSQTWWWASTRTSATTRGRAATGGRGQAPAGGGGRARTPTPGSPANPGPTGPSLAGTSALFRP